MERNQNPYNPTKNTLHFRYRILFTHRKDGERQKEHLVYLKCKCANNDDKHAALDLTKLMEAANRSAAERRQVRVDSLQP